MPRRYLVPTISTLFILSLSAAPAFSFTGEVVTVLDGNTIEVLHNGKTERVRLQGIDCPEKSQPFGDKAKQATSDLVFALEVTLEIHGKDKHGRVLADALLADGTNVNHALVKDGWCRWSRKSAPKAAALEQLEAEAREGKRGVWADSDPVP
ncbi:MAG: thermonuclease family protein [Nitrospira sp.]